MPLNYKAPIKEGLNIYTLSLLKLAMLLLSFVDRKTNPYSKNEEKEVETDFFEVVTETITLALQNLIYFEKIRDRAYIDGLTQIYNRKYMDIFLPKKTKAYVHNNINFAIVMFDIDYFKKFNDTYGHQFGDLVLRELSKIVSKNIREIDVLFRYGGEEFVIFSPI